MKKTILFLLVFALLIAPALLAQVWHTANQITVAWDAVTTLENGDPLPPDSSIQYVVYIANAVTDPGKTNPVIVTPAPITETTYTITLNTEGQYFIGFQAERLVAAEEVSTSVISWSDDPAYCQGGVTFGVRYFLAPSAPGNSRAT